MERQLNSNRLVEIQVRRSQIIQNIHELGSKLASSYVELGVVASEFQETFHLGEPDNFEAKALSVAENEGMVPRLNI